MGTKKEVIFDKVNYLKTDKYDLFSFLPFNRPVDNSHINRLVDSMKKNGFKGVIQVIKTSIIDGEEKLYVLEGQHRFSAAKRLGIPFCFEITDLDTKKETADFISELNNSAKGWGPTQFLKVWSGMNIKEYVRLNKVSEETGFQITALLHAYDVNSREFRKGVMKFSNEKSSDKIIKQMISVNKYLSSKAYCRRAIISVMKNEKYKHIKMKKAIKDFHKLHGFSDDEKTLKEQLQTLLDNVC